MLPAALIVMAGVLVSATAFSVFFSADDLVYFAYAQSRPWPGIVDAAAHRWLSGAGAFRVCRWLFGVDAGLFHLPVFGVHIVNALLVWWLARRLEPARPHFALTAGLVFVGHAAAFTVLAWLSAGFNEAPAVTAALVATHLTLTGMERRSVWFAGSAGAVIFLATGFKQHVVLAVAYVAMFGVYFGLKTLRSSPRRSWMPPLAAAVVVVSTVAVWLAAVVVPRMPADFSRPPYTRVYTPQSVGAGYLRYLPHALNPLAVAREALGYQQALPPALAASTTTGRTGLRIVMLVAWVVVLWGSATRLALLSLAGTAATVLVAALSVAVVLPAHQYDYYAYFGLPAASMLAAMPIGALWRVVRERVGMRQVFVPAAGAALLLAVWYQGRLLRSTNALAANAEHARIIDRLAQTVPSNSTLYFVPPVSRAREDTLQGASLALLRPEKALTVQFAGDPGIPDVFAARPGLLLVETRATAGGGWEAALLERAQWRNPETTLRLENGAEVRQPFRVGDAGLASVHVLVSPWIARCEGAFAIEAATDSAALPVEPLASGRLDCRRDIAGSVAVFAAVPGRLPRGEYSLRIRVDSGVLELPVSRAVDMGFAPVSYRHHGAWEPREYTLAMREVLRVVKTRP